MVSRWVMTQAENYALLHLSYFTWMDWISWLCLWFCALWSTFPDVWLILQREKYTLERNFMLCFFITVLNINVPSHSCLFKLPRDLREIMKGLSLCYTLTFSLLNKGIIQGTRPSIPQIICHGARKHQKYIKHIWNFLLML